MPASRTTTTVSPPPSVADPAFEAWLDSLTLDLASSVLAGLESALLAAIRALSPRTLVASADTAAARSAFAEAWGAYVSDTALGSVAATYAAGQAGATASLALSGRLPPGPVLAPVLNERAVAHSAAAGNRLVRVADEVWADSLRPRITAGIASGLTIPALQKDLVSAVPEMSAFRAERIARTETVGAYNAGNFDFFDSLPPGLGPSMKSWSAHFDARTRPDHVRADGQAVLLADFFRIGGALLAFPGDPSGPADQVINCRCAVLYHYPGDRLPDGSTVPLDEPTYPFGSVDSLREAPSSEQGVGGAHDKTIYTGADGRLWMFKPQDEFLADLDVATAAVTRLAGLPAPDVFKVTINGRVGSIQSMFGTRASRRPAFGSGAFDPTRLRPDDVASLQQHHALDWLLGNHDGHSGQFIREGPPGSPFIAIDKGQSFRFFANDRLDPSYHPNGRYGEKEPVYNLLHRAYVEDRVPLTLLSKNRRPGEADLWAFVDRLSAIPDNEYRALFRPYVEGLRSRGLIPNRFGSVDGMLDAMVARKNSLGDDLRKFHSRLYSARSRARGPRRRADPSGFALKGLADAHPISDTEAAVGTFGIKAAAPGHPAAGPIRNYTGAYYRDYNAYLRGVSERRIHADDIARLDKAIPPVTRDVLVQRSTSLRQVLERYGLGSVEDLKGRVFVDKGFMSSSAGSAAFESSSQPTLHIRLSTSAGSRALYVDPISSNPGEREVIIAPGSHFYVHEVRPADPMKGEFGSHVIEMEAVPPGWTPDARPAVGASLLEVAFDV